MGLNLKPFPDRICIHGIILHRIPDNDFIGDQLKKIFITCNHDDGNVVTGCHFGQGTDEIICLITRLFDHRYVEPLCYLFYVWNLNRQISRHGGAIRFITVIDFVPKGGALYIKQHDSVLRGLFLQ